MEIEHVGLFSKLCTRARPERYYDDLSLSKIGNIWRCEEVSGMKHLQKDSEAAEGLQGTAVVPPSLIDVFLLPWTFFQAAFLAILGKPFTSGMMHCACIRASFSDIIL